MTVEMQHAGASDAADDMQARMGQTLTTLLSHLDSPARLEFRSAADGGLECAVHLNAAHPGLPEKKRSTLLDALQFLTNKLVNKPGQPVRRWVSLGVGSFPEAKERRGVERTQAAPPGKPAPAATLGQNQMRGTPGTPGSPRVSGTPAALVEVAPDPVLARLGKLLSEKSGRHGRLYAVLNLNAEQRTQMAAGAMGTEGVRTRTEGQSPWMRLAFVPDKPQPMPSRRPIQDDDDDVQPSR